MLQLLLQWLENDFLAYLQVWEDSVKDFPAYERKKMMLSQETLEGLRITGVQTKTFFTVSNNYSLYRCTSHDYCFIQLCPLSRWQGTSLVWIHLHFC